MTDNRADASLTTPEALAVSLTINGRVMLSFSIPAPQAT